MIEKSVEAAIRQVASLVAETTGSSFKTVLNTISDALKASLTENFETTTPFATAIESTEEEAGKLKQNAAEIESSAPELESMEKQSATLLQDAHQLGPAAREALDTLAPTTPRGRA